VVIVVEEWTNAELFRLYECLESRFVALFCAHDEETELLHDAAVRVMREMTLRGTA
jgi:hypothetical protein